MLDNNVTLKPDTVVHVWKWWPVNSITANPDAPQDMMDIQINPGLNSSSIQQSSQQSSQLASQQYSQLPSQQSSQQSTQPSNTFTGSFSQQSQRQSHGPANCQLSKGCPGEVGSYSAGEEPGWFPEMEKVTAQVCALHLGVCMLHLGLRAFNPRHLLLCD